MSLGLNILLIFIFLLLGSVFAGTELALVSLRGSQIDQMEQEDARGKRVAQIARDPNPVLSTVQSPRISCRSSKTGVCRITSPLP